MFLGNALAFMSIIPFLISGCVANVHSNQRIGQSSKGHDNSDI